MADRCTGHCCREFPLPFDPATLKWMARKARRSQAAGQKTIGSMGPISNLPASCGGRAVRRQYPSDMSVEQLLKVTDMVVFRRFGPVSEERRKTLHVDQIRPESMNKPMSYYTCRHFDGANCTNYDDRPTMCSKYPYGSACENKACTDDAHRIGGPVWQRNEEGAVVNVSDLSISKHEGT